MGMVVPMLVLMVMLVGMGDAVGVQVGVIVDLAGGGACMFVIPPTSIMSMSNRTCSPSPPCLFLVFFFIFIVV